MSTDQLKLSASELNMSVVELNKPTSAVKEEKKNSISVPHSDKLAISILFFLYLLQGIPIGLTVSTTLLLQNRKVTYKEQAVFSFAFWPFSMKLLWAPIVDALYWRKFGRRKSWLIPAQTLLGVVMFVLSFYIYLLLGDDHNAPNVPVLTFIFFCLNFLTATQDIAVDGWAITMLSRKNVAYASVCNTTGQKFGVFIGNVLFLVLESKDFCNKYLRSVPQPYGLVSIGDFLLVSGIIFVVATIIILIFKSEEEEDEDTHEFRSIKDTYFQLYHILRLRNILLLIAILLTYQIATSVADTVSRLKFVDAGVSKEKYALLETPNSLMEMVLPFCITRFVVGKNPLNLFLKAFPIKLVSGFLLALLVWWTFSLQSDAGTFPTYYYAIIIMSLLLHKALSICVFLPLTSFFNKISDPLIGGTYMTLLNTCYNIGTSWTSTVALWGVDVLTFKECDNNNFTIPFNCDTNTTTVINSTMLNSTAISSTLINSTFLDSTLINSTFINSMTTNSTDCSTTGPTCTIIVDGYYIESIICVLFGLLWLIWGYRVIQRLQKTTLDDWKTALNKKKDVENKHTK